MSNKQSKVCNFLLALTIGLTLFTACNFQQKNEQLTQEQIEIPEGVFYVNPADELGNINPMVYGINHGPWAIITEQTLPYAQTAGITLLRFPGGNWGDENDLQPYHIDQFAALADQMNSQLSINVRLFNGTPEKAAELVRYANIEKGYAIKYWGIGNEPSLFATARGAPDYGVDQFNTEWRAIAQAMKIVDPDILLIGPELHQFGSSLESSPKDPAGKDWMTEFLKANGDLVDVVSIHRYPFPQGRGGKAATIDELKGTSAEWDQIIPYLRSLIFETTGQNIPIAVTEVNSHWSNAVGGEATPDSFYNAIWWADVLGRMIVNRVDIVNYFSLHSNPSIGGYGILSRSAPRPTYYVYEMYNKFGSQLVTAVSADSQAGIYAALQQDGTPTIMFVNLSDQIIQKPFIVQGVTQFDADVWRFDEMTQAVMIGNEVFISGELIDLPPQSLTLLVIK
ncbi:MAG TPA: hypothetical protein VK856_00175 [Anaerolineaceae bacterium]|nr:hypothetical protein [Anaerolineaceae bacterium]